MVSWPESLPREFEAPGYRDELPEQLFRSVVDADSGESRRSARHEVKAPIAGVMIMESEEWLTLKEFYLGTLGCGALAFDIPDPDDSASTIRVSFLRPPNLTNVGGDVYRVQLAFERE